MCIRDAATVKFGVRIRLTPATSALQSDQRGRTRGIDDDSRPTCVEHIGQSSGKQVMSRAGTAKCIDFRKVLILQQQIVAGMTMHANEHSHGFTSESLANHTRVVERIECRFQHDALLRVHLRRFARRYAEIGCVKLINVLDKAAPARSNFSCCVGILVIQAIGIPAFARHRRDRVDAVAQQTPKLVQIIGAAGKTTCCADDRNRLACSRTDPGRRTRGVAGEMLHQQGALFGREIGDALANLAHEIGSANPAAASKRRASSMGSCSISRRMASTSTSACADGGTSAIGSAGSPSRVPRCAASDATVG
jgi:hypothetical protein